MSQCELQTEPFKNGFIAFACFTSNPLGQRNSTTSYVNIFLLWPLLKIGKNPSSVSIIPHWPISIAIATCTKVSVPEFMVKVILITAYNLVVECSAAQKGVLNCVV